MHELWWLFGVFGAAILAIEVFVQPPSSNPEPAERASAKRYLQHRASTREEGC